MASRLLMAALSLACAAAQADAASLLDDPWPAPALNEGSGMNVVVPSHSPFVLEDVGGGTSFNQPRDVSAKLFLPEGISAARKASAVVLLHGTTGVMVARELSYGAQYAAMGVAALVVDTFGSRRDIATSPVDRMLRITETMMIADAYAALHFLASRPDIDGQRVALIGFSYGALAALLSAYEQPASRFSADGLRFAAHITYYGPCLAKFEDFRATGAPVLMLSGERDVIADPKRCGETADELRRGGARVEQIRYAGAYPLWDGEIGEPANPVRRPNNFAPCRFTVQRDGTVRDAKSGLEMSNGFSRKLILAMCYDPEGYLQARDDAVRQKSNRDVGKFLATAFEAGAPSRTRKP